MSLVNTIYNVFLKRYSTFYLTAFAGVFFLERAIDVGGDSIFDTINQGKQWKDIKDKYAAEE